MFKDKDFNGNIIYSSLFSPSLFEELNKDEISKIDINSLNLLIDDNILEKNEEENFKITFDKVFKVNVNINNINDTSNIYSDLKKKENDIELSLITPINLNKNVVVIPEVNTSIVIDIPKIVEYKKGFKIFEENINNALNKEIFIVKKKKLIKK
jgi:hypothetical protein